MIVFDYLPRKRKAQIRCDESVFEFVRNYFSVVNDAKRHVKNPQKKKYIPDRIYAITPSGLFDFGIFQEIRKFLIKSQFTEIEFTPEFKKRLVCGFKLEDFWDQLKFPAHYFQKETITQAVKYGYGTYLLATGAGKSLTQALLIENLIRVNPKPFKCLILVPGIGLVEQLEKDFKEYGVTFTYSGWTGSKPLQNTDVIICNMEYFRIAFDKHPWIMDVDYYIQDECHKINKVSNVSKLVGKIKTYNKFGFTGSLSEVMMDRLKTLGTFGPILYEKNSKELRDEKFLSPAKVTFLRLEHQRSSDFNYRDELEYLYFNEKRNKLINNLVSKFTKNTLIIVNHLDHGKELLRHMENNGKKVYFVEGKVDVDTREEIKRLMETNDDVVCIAMSSIFSTGINIKNIHYILLVGLGKAFIRLVQTIGRGLRLHESKDVLTIFDMYDNLKYSEAHMMKRREVYSGQEIPWNEKVLKL